MEIKPAVSIDLCLYPDKWTDSQMEITKDQLVEAIIRLLWYIYLKSHILLYQVTDIEYAVWSAFACLYTLKSKHLGGIFRSQVWFWKIIAVSMDSSVGRVVASRKSILFPLCEGLNPINVFISFLSFLLYNIFTCIL